MPEDASSPLRNAVFRNLWIASLVSGVGSTMHDTGAAWTLATQGASPQWVALYQTMSSLPLFLFALPAGVVADLTDRRHLVLATQIIGALFAAFVALAAALGHTHPSLLLGSAFALGLVFAFSNPAWQALMPEIIARSQMPQAVTLGSVGVNVARSLGPVAAGLLLARYGPQWVFGFNALSYLVLAGVLLAWRRSAPAQMAHGEQFGGAMIAAVRYVRHAPPFRAALVRGSAWVACAIAVPALLPVVARGRGFDAATFGAMLGAYGGGAVVTALFLLPWLRRKLTPDRVLTAFSLLGAVSVAGFAVSPSGGVMFLALAGAGAAWVGNFSTFNVATQAVLPGWIRARGSAIQLLVMQATIAGGALAWGSLAARIGAPGSLLAAGVGLLGSVLLVPLFRLDVIDKLNPSPSDHWEPHRFTVQPPDNAGPVLISIEYCIAAGDAAAFRAAMLELRRVRLRDGSLRWSLWQELGVAQCFRESFVVATWGEHLRQHQRATQDDSAIEAAALAFHRGPQPPSIRHFLQNTTTAWSAGPAPIGGTHSTSS